MVVRWRGKAKIIVIWVALSFVGQGCSALNWTQTPLKVTASEPDAYIYVNGGYEGVGKVTTLVNRRESVSVMAKKPGFNPAVENVSYRIGTPGIIDFIGGFVFLFPFLGLAFPGAYTTSVENVTLILEPIS